MVIEALQKLFERDLIKLKREIELYENDDLLWKIENSIKNSEGNLCLHIIGNLKTFIGNGLAQTDYVRQRDFEFSGKYVDRNKLYKALDETIKVVTEGLSKVTEEKLNDDFPILIWEEKKGMVFTLIHLHCHLNYHLGQVNYHRRLIN